LFLRRDVFARDIECHANAAVATAAAHMPIIFYRLKRRENRKGIPRGNKTANDEGCGKEPEIIVRKYRQNELQATAKGTR
jgi:hypothetical protein